MNPQATQPLPLLRRNPWRSVLFLIALFSLLISAAFSWWSLKRSRNNAAGVQHTYDVLAASQALFSHLRDAETSQRGYLLTGNPEYLRPYKEALLHIGNEQRRLCEFSDDGALHQQQCRQVAALSDAKLQELAETIRLYDAGQAAAALDIVKANTGQQLMAQLEASLQKLQEEEQQAFTQRARNAQSTAAEALLASGLGNLFVFSLLIAGFVSLQRDNKRREQAELALARSEAELRLIADRVPALVSYVDAGGRYVRANATYAQWFGLPLDQILGKKLEEVIPNVLGTPYWSKVHNVLRCALQGLPSQVETLGNYADRSRHVEINYTPDLDENGHVRGVVVFVHDVSVQKAAEAKVKQWSEELESRVEERTRQLAEANHELEAFSYSVSHDLRAPLRTMQGLSEALLEDYATRLDAEGLRYLNAISSSAAQLDEIIQDLLAYGRLSRAEIRLESITVSGILAEVLRQHKATIERTQASIQIVEPLPVVCGHKSVLNQVFSNLLENAMRFVPSGVQPEVKIWAEPQGACARIWVQDNGIGIEPQHHQAIFNVFHRLHGVADYPGTGIGLAIVKRGIERLGGQVGLQSAPGQGSRFWIELPVSKGTPFTHDFDHSSHTRG